MEWLTRLPGIGPLISRLMRTHAWRSYETLDRVKWTRLAAAITFTSFVALFPLLTVGAAVGAAVLSEERMRDLERRLAEQVPGISGQLDLSSLVDNAGTVGLVAGALLLFTGISWIGSLRECLRAVWEKEESPGNPVVLRLKDGALLLGLGGVLLLSLACSVFASAAVDWVVGKAGLQGVGVLLTAAGFCIAVLADFLLMLYVLSRLPDVQPPVRRLVVGALIGAIGLEALKLLLGGYLRGVAAKSMYGAFGTPIALLLWINFMAKLVLFCAAWTATRSPGEKPAATARNHDGEGPAE
ncbi:YihY/virulence factor BrkB family protein [Streptomyces roseoverticillatus]|uniref:YihY/virulence factor BrkB family protein n=1 Tax=Streptomyces roseoverticillatus TaxID=66429 RepID=UPI001F4876BA|nr:YihY/virulence factor BrkB family protein [Streptomyces roseoverticillatus]MCF3103851.1 YihY/virulence factor BrkB family protein [Streptomyces roseoverticillatus]